MNKAFKNGQSKICGRQPLKNLKGYGLLKQTLPLQVFHFKTLPFQVFWRPSINFTWSIIEYFITCTWSFLFAAEFYTSHLNFVAYSENVMNIRRDKTVFHLLSIILTITLIFIFYFFIFIFYHFISFFFWIS